jgi:hypothetical protein
METKMAKLILENLEERVFTEKQFNDFWAGAKPKLRNALVAANFVDITTKEQWNCPNRYIMLNNEPIWLAQGAGSSYPVTCPDYTEDLNAAWALIADLRSITRSWHTFLGELGLGTLVAIVDPKAAACEICRCLIIARFFNGAKGVINNE